MDTPKDITLRIRKLVVYPDKVEAMRALYDKVAHDLVRSQPGNLGVRLYRNVDTPNAMFVHSWWDDATSVRRMESQLWHFEAEGQLRALLIERTKVWEASIVLDFTQGVAIEPAGTEVMRFVRVAIPPENAKNLNDAFFYHSKDFVLKQPGCLGIRLSKSVTTPTTYFVHSWWKSAAFLDAAIAKPGLQEIRQVCLGIMLERYQTWNLQLLHSELAQSSDVAG